jgi:hypothetical protein
MTMERKRSKNPVTRASLFVLFWIFWIMFMFFDVDDENSGTNYEFFISIGFALGLVSLAISIFSSIKFPEFATEILSAGFAVYLLIGAIFHFLIKKKFGSLYHRS